MLCAPFMAYSKPWRSVADQLAQLQARGMHIGDVAKAADYLERIGEIASHLRDNEQIDHWRVQLRYMTLLQRPGMTPDSNPLGLETIRRGLWALCRESGGLLDQQFVRLERLEEMLALKLPEIYVEMNDLLERRGVAPAQALEHRFATLQLHRVAGAVRRKQQRRLVDQPGQAAVPVVAVGGQHDVEPFALARAHRRARERPQTARSRQRARCPAGGDRARREEHGVP